MFSSETELEILKWLIKKSQYTGDIQLHIYFFNYSFDSVSLENPRLPLSSVKSACKVIICYIYVKNKNENYVEDLFIRYGYFDRILSFRLV